MIVAVIMVMERRHQCGNEEEAKTNESQMLAHGLMYNPVREIVKDSLKGGFGPNIP
jgi:hypothetical protein